MLRLFYLPLFTFYLALTLLPTAAHAQTPPPITDDEVNHVASQLFCPTCANTPVDVCPTQTCSDWRALIRQQLADGQSEQEILDYFAAQFGSEVLSDPPREGFGMLLWITPLVVVIGGLALFGRYLQGLRRAAEPTTVAPPTLAPLDEATRSKIEEQLRQ